MSLIRNHKCNNLAQLRAVPATPDKAQSVVNPKNTPSASDKVDGPSKSDTTNAKRAR